MSPEDWAQIKHAFTAALNLPAGERDAFVAAACDDRAEIIGAVAELLRAHADASQTFLHPDSLVVAPRWLFQEGDYVACRFRVVRRIARGSMGEVYQVFDERLRQHIALKAIRPELVEDLETVERFRREVLVTRDIAHEGLCRVFDLVEHKIETHPVLPANTIIPCLTMQLLEGETLEDWIASRRPLAAAEALPLIEQIASALHVLHEAGVVHRDLKPSNVMLVREDGKLRAILTDFGLAKPLDEAMFETQTRVQGGAPFFMAPELFQQQGPSITSDVYAFGLLIDEMITATRAFTADALHNLLMQKLKGTPLPASKRGSTAPRHWEQVIQCCLTRDPRDRFASVQDVMAALRLGSRWSRWQCSVRWMRSTYLPRRWRPLQSSAPCGDLGFPAHFRAAGDPAFGCDLELRQPDRRSAARLPRDWKRVGASPTIEPRAEPPGLQPDRIRNTARVVASRDLCPAGPRPAVGPPATRLGRAHEGGDRAGGMVGEFRLPA